MIWKGSVHVHAFCRDIICKCCTVSFIHSMYVTVHELSKWKEIIYNAACLRLWYPRDGSVELGCDVYPSADW